MMFGQTPGRHIWPARVNSEVSDLSLLVETSPRNKFECESTVSEYPSYLKKYIELSILYGKSGAF